jgi:hypothetical protein
VSVEDEDLRAGDAGAGEAAASADRAGGVEAGGDAAEDAFNRGADERSDAGDRREQRRFDRVLRDRAILRQQLLDERAARAADQATFAADRARILGTEIERAEQDMMAAVSAGDAEAQARANRRVAELAAARTAASYEARSAKERADGASAQAKTEREAPAEAAGPSQATQRWLDQNRWWGQDQRMTRQALVLHQEALEDGFEPDTAAYFRHIEAGLETRFPGKVTTVYSKPGAGGARPAREAAADEGDGEAAAADPALAARVPARSASGAAPASRAASGGPAPAAGSLRLSPEAVEMAKILGITPAQYAARATQLVSEGRISRGNIVGKA